MLSVWLLGPPIKDGMNKNVENINRMLEQIAKAKEGKTSNSEVLFEPKIPKNIFSTRLRVYHVDPEELARQITLVYADIMANMGVNYFISFHLF